MKDVHAFAEKKTNYSKSERESNQQRKECLRCSKNKFQLCFLLVRQVETWKQINQN